MWKLVTVMEVLTVNDVEKETIKELMELTKWVKTFKETDNINKLEKRLTDMTHNTVIK